MSRAKTRVWLNIVLLGALGFIALLGCAKRDDGGSGAYITIKGSDTMVHLVSTWAEAFMAAHPESEVSVTGGGSGTGIAALINGTTGICAASRAMKEKEISMAEEKGMQPQEIEVAKDGIAVVVHPDNPVSEVTLAQLAEVFTGRSKRWDSLGGADQDIIVLSRESSSGTYVFFQEHVLNKEDYTTKARLLPATSAIIQEASTNRGAIGYVGLGYALGAADKVKILAVKADENPEAIVPSAENVKDGAYSIARSLYFYTKGIPEGSVKEFIDFCLSPEGQKIVQETGYVSIN